LSSAPILVPDVREHDAPPTCDDRAHPPLRQVVEVGDADPVRSHANLSSDGSGRYTSGLGFEDEVERRLGGPAELREARFLEHLPEPSLTRLGAEASPTSCESEFGVQIDDETV